MPTYEYECTKCGKQWERFQSIKAEPERDCPKCGRATARRKVGIGFAILSGGRSGDAGESGGASDGAKKGSGDAKGAAAAPGGSKAAAGEGSTKGTATDAPAAPAPKDDGKLNSTHPARDGRGAGNLRDAIARQRAAGGKKASDQGARGGKSPKKPAARGPSRGKR